MKDAATIAVVGAATVMAALTILMIAIMAITRLVPRGKETKTEASRREMPDEGTAKECVAAVAVAVALAMEADKRVPVVSSNAAAGLPQPSVSRWVSAGREQLMRSRGRTGQRWGKTS